MKKIKEILHDKRKKTEEHIKSLLEDGKDEIRYTAKISDIQFLILGLLSDVGWILELVSDILYFNKYKFKNSIDYIALVPLIFLLIGISYILYLNKIHEKEICKKYQLNLSFGFIILAGILGIFVSIFQMIWGNFSILLILNCIGSFINFVFGLPIYLSFKKGIFYGIR